MLKFAEAMNDTYLLRKAFKVKLKTPNESFSFNKRDLLEWFIVKFCKNGSDFFDPQPEKNFLDSLWKT